MDGTRGSLSLGWHSNVRVDLRSFSCFHIDVAVQESFGTDKWRFTGFYGLLDVRFHVKARRFL